MPSDVLDAVESRVGSRQFSAYVTEAVRRQLAMERLDEFLAQAGPVSEADLAAADALLEAALSRPL
jgi:hypothetical protein